MSSGEADGYYASKLVEYGYCGSLEWTVKEWGRITHKHSCPNRTDLFCQTHPKKCPKTPKRGSIKLSPGSDDL